jgi:hypothetical protein
MKEGEQGSFRNIIDADPGMIASRAAVERIALMQAAREKRARKLARKTFRMYQRAERARRRQLWMESLVERDTRNDLKMRIFRLDTEIADMKVELAERIFAAKARMAMVDDIEWGNC